MKRWVCASVWALLWWAGVVCYRGAAQQNPSAQIDFVPSVESVVNFPFVDKRDMIKVNNACQSLLSEVRDGPDNGSGTDRFLMEVAAFTSTTTLPHEQYFIENFARSNDKAVRRLRDEIGLPLPKGGAIVRIYPSKEAMPGPIRALFQKQVGGITWRCRFIAIVAEEKSEVELRDTIAHELAHAYIGSCLGMNFDKLPRWFHEGVALYLSDAKDLYSSPSGLGTERLSWSTKDYDEFRTVFRYLEATQGRRRVDRFIRQAVEQQSVDKLLRDLADAGDYTALRNRALKWRTTRDLMRTAMLSLAVFVSAMLWRRLLRRRQRRWNLDLLEAEIAIDARRERGQGNLEEVALALVLEARLLARKGDRSTARSKLEEALSLAPWSVRLQQAVDDAEDEIDGAIV